MFVLCDKCNKGIAVEEYKCEICEDLVCDECISNDLKSCFMCKVYKDNNMN